MEPFRDLYRALIDVAADMPIRTLLTVGETADPAALGSLPANVRVERFWPQADAMSDAAAIVGHGGFGTTMIGLAHGVPMVLVPLFALDQHFNAEAVGRAGAGIVVDVGPTVAPDIERALRRVLDDRSFTSNARAVAAEMAALPSPSDGVDVLEALDRFSRARGSRGPWSPYR